MLIITWCLLVRCSSQCAVWYLNVDPAVPGVLEPNHQPLPVKCSFQVPPGITSLSPVTYFLNLGAGCLMAAKLGIQRETSRHRAKHDLGSFVAVIQPATASGRGCGSQQGTGLEAQLETQPALWGYSRLPIRNKQKAGAAEFPIGFLA